MLHLVISVGVRNNESGVVVAAVAAAVDHLWVISLIESALCPAGRWPGSSGGHVTVRGLYCNPVITL